VVINGVPMFQPINPAEVFSLPPDKAENVLAKQFYDTLIRFKTARVIRPSPGGRFKAEPVFTSIPNKLQISRGLAAIADRNVTAFDNAIGTFKDLAMRGELSKKIN